MNEAVCVATKATLASMLLQNRKEIKEIEATLNSLMLVISREVPPVDGSVKKSEPSSVMEEVAMQLADLERISALLIRLAETIS